MNWTKEEGCKDIVAEEDARWKQRAKVHWLTHGDRNTKFYHTCVNQRRKKNSIKQIVDGEGRVLSSKEEVVSGFRHHFNKVYQSSNPTKRSIQHCLSGVEHRISRGKSELLDKEFSSEEEVVALKQMSPFKSPGPDGFTVGFYQDHWDIVGSDVVKAVLEFFRTGEMPVGLNHTLIALIPKINSPKSVNGQSVSVMCEGLSTLLQQAEVRGLIKGVAVTRGGKRINHLLFADDCVMFCRSKIEEWSIIVHLLKIYEEASGQTLNRQKTSILFSSNTNAAVRESISQQAEGVICDSYNKYLGLPTTVGKSKHNTSRGLKEKIWKRINSWKTSFQSSAGKEIMIKSVLQAYQHIQ
ncbi:uncharacterized protein LOC122304756 [Carya illinoinensis]|uniref:uncharacterized protein LOC122304756 n=1 Tax=Carya illinoinensis TaxID=32201 RepID=UPI001C72019E|nr:uncharacterized protein LOC122304756 [Carya illinoinensis]